MLGSTMGTLAELRQLVTFMSARSIAPVVDTVVPMADAANAYTRLASGDAFGKVVLEMPGA